MKKMSKAYLGAVFAASCVLSLASAPVLGQAKDAAVAVNETEGIVKVTKIDRKARTVTVKGPTGNEVTMKLPPESQNLDQVKVGSTFKMKYVEALALVLSKGGTPAVSTDQTVRLAPKGGNPGGVVVNTAKITGTLESIDREARTIAVKGPKGNVRTMKVAADAKGFEDVAIGDSISLVFSEALAMEMIPGDKPKAASK